MPLRVRVSEPDQPDHHLEHLDGPLEFGRGRPTGVKRHMLGDPSVSRNHVRIEERPGGRLRVENLSDTRAVSLNSGEAIDVHQHRELELPVQLTVGDSRIVIEPVPSQDPRASDTRAERALSEIVEVEPPTMRLDAAAVPVPADLASAAGVDYLGTWLDTAAELQNAGAGSPDFYRLTAEALVRLVGLDYGLVLLCVEGTWRTAGSAAARGQRAGGFSTSLVSHVATHRRSIYRDLNRLRTDANSLADIDAAVVSPVFGLQDDVVGVLYGVRTRHGLTARGSVTALESRLVQMLAGAVGAYLARSAALRTRIQFEQFFSPDLVRELERDPDLLEGRFGEVTVLFSDLRGFTALSQRLGAQLTCRMLRDMMECLSARIVERGGAIVDYAGDGILAMWNAPVAQPDHAALACRAALDMLAELPGLNERWAEDAGGALSLGIGINTGEAQVGNTGSTRKFKYGPHGHAVNLASRIQDATKRLGVSLLIADRTRDGLPAEMSTRRLGAVRLPGVAEPVTLFELHDGPAAPDWMARRDIYERALALYEEGRWSEACQTAVPLLAPVDSASGYDTPTLKLIRRAWDCLESRPTPFEPIIDVSSK